MISPGEVQFSSTTRTFSGTPTAAASAVTVTVTAMDTSGGSAEATFELTVAAADATTFITTWQVAAGATLTIPTTSDGYNYTVNWGDGLRSTGRTSNATHPYVAADEYTVTISGAFPRLWIGNQTPHRTRIRSVEQWGTQVWGAIQSGAFNGAANLVVNATDDPNWSGVTHMNNMFANTANFNADISDWDVSNVTNMQGMFSGAAAFNQSLNDWIVSKVENFRDMFRNAGAFNGDISGWRPSAGTSFNSMFYQATSFDQDIGNWTVGAGTDFRSMFRGATSFKAQNLGSWNVSSATQMQNMFNGVTLSDTNYDALLRGWSARTVQPSVTFHAGADSACTAAGREGKYILTSASNNWVITDGDCAPATAPLDATLTEAEAGNAQVTLTYAANDDGASAITKWQYTIDDGANWDDITDSAPGGANADGYTVPGLTNDTEYTFKVRAVNLVGEGAESDEATATPTAGATAPLKPGSFSATTGDGQVTLAWTSGGNGGSVITKWQYQQKAGSAGYGNWTSIDDSAPGETNADGYTVPGLTNDTEYTFKVRAVNLVGEGAESDEATATPTPAATAPLKPSSFSATAGDGQVTLAWTSGGDGGSAITEWEYRQKAGSAGYGNWTSIDDSAPGETNADGYTVPGLTNDTEYTFKVRAVNLVGDGAESDEAMATPTDVPTLSYTGVPTTSPRVGDTVSLSAIASGFSGTIEYSSDDGKRPAGLSLNTDSGAITGELTTAEADAVTFTITATAGADTATANINFPAVGKGAQTLSAFSYSPTSGEPSVAVVLAETPVATHEPTMATVRYASADNNICTVDLASGALTLVGDGICMVTATAAETDNYESASVTAQVTVDDPAPAPMLELSVAVESTAAFVEGSGSSIAFIVTASEAPASDLTVNYRVTQVGAFTTAGSRTLTFPAKATTFTQSIAVTNDDVAESDGSITFMLQDGTDYTVASLPADAATRDVHDDDKPAAPTNVKVEPGHEKLIVTWTPVPDANNGGSSITGYTATATPTGGRAAPRVAGNTGTRFATAAATHGHQCTASGATATTCTIRGLTNGQQYSVAVVTNSKGENSSPSSPQVTAPSVTEPDAPTGVTVTAGDGELTVTWTPVPDANNGGAAITRYTATATGGGTATTCEVSGATATTCTIGGLTNGQQYSVTVVAANSAGDSDSGPSDAVESTPLTVPDVPAGVTVVAGDGELTVAWTLVPDANNGGSPITGYTATATPTGSTTSAGSCETSGAGATTCTIRGLTNGQQYSVTVVASNAAGNSKPSEAVLATPPTVPDPPTNVAVKPGAGELTVTWTPVPDANNGGAAITRYTATATGGGTATTCEVSGATATTCIISGLTNGQQYSVTVVASNAAGNSKPSEAVLATPPTVPDPPTNVAVKPGAGELTVTWTPVPDANNGGAAITRYTATATGGGTATTCEVSGATATTCTIGGLTNGQQYSVTVVASNAAGDSGPSEAVLATPLPGLHEVILAEAARAMADSTVGAIGRRIGQAGEAGAGFTIGGQSDPAGILRAHVESLNEDSEALKKMLSGTGFVLPLNADGGQGAGLGSAAFWGSGEYRNLSGGSGGANWDGTLSGIHLGVDARVRENLLGGVAVSRLRSDLDYDVVGGDGARDEGNYVIDLTGVYPYMGGSLGRLELWATVGYGAGELKIARQDEASRTSDIDALTGGIGGGGELWTDGTTRLRLKGEGLLTEMAVEGGGGAGVEALKVSASRLRATLEGSRSWSLAGGGVLDTALEVGARHDGGDGVTGQGVEVGGEVGYAGGGFAVSARGRMLLAHSGDKEEWGVGGDLRYAPGAGGLGLSFSLEPSWGETGSGVAQLWGQNEAFASSLAGGSARGGRVDTELGYGLASSLGGVLTPYGGASLAEDGVRDYRLGVRFDSRIELSLEVGRHERAEQPAEHEITLRAKYRLGAGFGSGIELSLEAGRHERAEQAAEHEIMLRATLANW